MKTIYNDLNKIAMYELKEHPILGVGVYGYQGKYKAYPHNVFAEVLVDYGIVLGSIFIMAFFLALLYIIKVSWNNVMYAVIAGIALASLSTLCFNDNLTCPVVQGDVQ